MKIKEFKSLSDEDLTRLLHAKREELLRLHLRRRVGSIEKHHQFPLLRRNIARIETIRRERMREKQEVQL
ncbi:MAG: 50S ribosomal protein L29 [Puniceicoccales bacterium]|jgi:large subunit ribosomal protein L29|nr:50S ribosomal protein L29 [Puniceicoccales bacterium]